MFSDFLSLLDKPSMLLAILFSILLHSPIHELGHYIVSKIAILKLKYKEPHYFKFYFGKEPFLQISKSFNISFKKIFTSGYIDTVFYDYLAKNYKEPNHAKVIKDIAIAGLYFTLIIWFIILLVFLNYFTIPYMISFILFTTIWLGFSTISYICSTDKTFHNDPHAFYKFRKNKRFK